MKRKLARSPCRVVSNRKRDLSPSPSNSSSSIISSIWYHADVAIFNGSTINPLGPWHDRSLSVVCVFSGYPSGAKIAKPSNELQSSDRCLRRRICNWKQKTRETVTGRTAACSARNGLDRLGPTVVLSTQRFLPRDAMLGAVYAVVVCLSVCLCVCVYHTPVLYQNG